MERDKFLTEAMGGGFITNVGIDVALTTNSRFIQLDNYDFSTWQGFGKLWEWSQDQEWWLEFLKGPTNTSSDHRFFFYDISLNHPDRFANAVYEFLKERNHEM